MLVYGPRRRADRNRQIGLRDFLTVHRVGGAVALVALVMLSF